jgi:type I restriction enzyme, R subunit
MSASKQQSIPSVNFAFLAVHDPLLVRLAAQAEGYVFTDPETALFKLRQWIETVAKQIAAMARLPDAASIELLGLLRRLGDKGFIPRDVSDLFHTIRMTGNRAVHDADGSRSDALQCLRFAYKIGVWFHRAFGVDPNSRLKPFLPPPNPQAASDELSAELERLRVQLAELAGAKTAANQADAARIEAERKATAAYSDLEAALALAQETQAERNQQKREFESRLAQMVTQPTAQALDVANIQAATNVLALDEADTRVLIDKHLREAGWMADTVNLKYSAGSRPQNGVNQAIAEWPTASGPADYVFFIGLMPVAVVEAKKSHVDIAGKVPQAERYSTDFSLHESMIAAGGPWIRGETTWHVPFCFATNGRALNRQIRQKSGIWWRDCRHITNQARPLESWYTPDGLLGLLAHDPKVADAKLAASAPDLPLRDYQNAAISAVEEAVISGRRDILVAMATGTGKTRTCIGLLHRMLRSDRFRRILFLVDRTTLGNQADDAFKDVRLEGLTTFADMFEVKSIADQHPDTNTRVHIATVQGMVKRLLFPSDDAEPIPVDRYDCVVIDECHRGYVLDRDLTDTELEYNNLDEYLAKYRQVLDRFDAVRVGLTATPALHTVQIFGKPVFTYTYRQAVIDGWLIDHEPPIRITTALSAGGIHWKKGEELKIYNPETELVDLTSAPDDIDVEVESFNRLVVTEPFNRVVCAQLADNIDPVLPGKTLIFAASDVHADLVVDLLSKAFIAKFGAQPNDTVLKITSQSPDPEGSFRRFKNEANQVKVAVTVDLLTTGIDVPPIVNLVFLRRVKSRILYEQMLGRATRLCEDLFGPGDDKQIFRIYDAVDLYAALAPVSSMKPVVKDPDISITQLVAEVTKAATPEARAAARDGLCALLRRYERRKKYDADAFAVHSGGFTPSDLAKKLAADEVAAVAAWFSAHPNVASYCDRQGSSSGRPLLISEHPDELASVEQGYGTDSAGRAITRPEDYLNAFAKWISSNRNRIPALISVCTKPRDLTRAQLKELKAILDTAGFSEKEIRRATLNATSTDYAATIIGFIRSQALGVPLIDYADRVKTAVARIQAKHGFTGAKRDWLLRFQKALVTDIVLDPSALDRGEFGKNGGFARFDKLFDHTLTTLLADLQDEIWRDLAA